MNDYTIHASSIDLYASNRIAAKVAREEGMGRTGERHDELALHIQNAERWAVANCPEGFRIQTTIRFEAVPDVNARYNGDRDIYTHEED